MAMKSPTISTLPPPPKYRAPGPPKYRPPPPPPLPQQLHLSKKITANQREQKQTLKHIQSNINKLQSLSQKTQQPTITPSTNTTNNEIGEEKKISSTSINYDDTENDPNAPKIDIFNVYGIPQTNTNLLTWNDITSNYKYTGQEISGAHELQFELSKLYEINDKKKKNQLFPPFECLRYFCGCSQEIDRAIQKWSYSIKMYNEYEMNKISSQEIIECFKILSKSISFGGLDIDECRIITIKYSLFYFSEYKNINIFLLAGFYLFYYLTHDIKAHRNGICLLCDLNDFGLSNFSFTVEKTGIHFFQKVLPIRIKKVFVVDAPFIAHYALKLVLPLLNEKLKKRVFIVTNDELYQDNDDNNADGNDGNDENEENDNNEKDGNIEELIPRKIINKYELPKLIGGCWDKKYLNENKGEQFLYNILSLYYTKTIDLKHFDVDFEPII